MPVDELRSIRKAAQEADVPVYLDGARIFNASAASETPVHEFAAEVDALMFSLSKGLGAPIGSVLCGPADFIADARRAKILFGGAWRQAGIMAAAGLVALEEGRARIVDDHVRARRLAETLAELLPSGVDLEMVETNMVFVHTEAMGLDALETIERLAVLGVGAVPVTGAVRMVTHVDVDDDGIARAIDAWRAVVAGAAKEP